MELIRKEQNSFQYFDKVTSLDRGHSFLFIYLLLIYIYIYIYTFLNTTSLTHVTSFRHHYTLKSIINSSNLSNLFILNI